MAAHKYSLFDYKFEGTFSQVSDLYSYVKLPYEVVKDTKKILFILDFVPKEDLESGRLLSGQTGDILDNLLIVAKDVYLKEKAVPFSWLACTFNAFKTLGKPKNFQDQAREAFTSRIESMILKYKPDVVVSFGAQPTRALIPEKLRLSSNKIGNWLGVPLKTTFNNSTQSHTCVVVPSISLNTISVGDANEASIMGYVSRHLANAINGSLLYAIDVKKIESHKTVLIDSISKFDKMLDMLYAQPKVCIDTETESLNKIINRLLTVQFAKCSNFAYIVPIYHKDTPFVAQELKYIKTKLCAYFEGANKNKIHIYANAQFDLNVLRTNLETCYMANNVWDIFGGEFGLDENLKFLTSITGDYYYSVGNLSTQYGFEGYLTAEFGKSDRKNILNTDLDEPLLRYMGLDVVVPFQIQALQEQRAAVEGHDKYASLIGEQFSDMIHGFSRMETTGSGLDVNYLFHLRTPASPIEAVIQDKTQKLLETPAVKQANAILVKQAGVPKRGLWGDANTQMFNLRTDAHKKLLFFDILDLKPLSVGVSINGAPGSGKLDKHFQEAYKSVAEVKMYTELGKAKKLKNAYVNNFLKLLATSEDFKSDYRIRPSYNYLVVITGRTSAKDPNLQQIPARGELSKHIKRLFVARPGTLYIKVDYRVHEVRGWGIIAMDRALAAVFEAAKKLRDAYRLHPTAELATKIKFEADVHIINAMYFFSKTIEEFIADPVLMKDLRNNVKAVIFGLIYQMSVKTLARTLKKELAFTQGLVKNFNKRFPSGMKWIESCKQFAREHLYYENPVGFRRHIWGYMLPKSSANAGKVHARMDRLAVNSPIQGMGAQFMAIGSRALDTMVFKTWKKKQRKIGMHIANSVHDSLETEFAYEDFLLGLDYIEKALTTKVRETVSKRVGFEFVVDLEIDFEIGAALSQVTAWDFSIEKLEEIVKTSLTFQRDELGHKLDVDKKMEVIFSKKDDMPKWMTSQISNLNYSFEYEQVGSKPKQKKAA